VTCFLLPQAKTLVKILLTQRTTAERALSANQLTGYLSIGSEPLLPIINSARLTLEPTIEPRDSNFILRSAAGYYFDLGSNVTWDVSDFRNAVYQAGAKQRAGAPASQYCANVASGNPSTTACTADACSSFISGCS